MAFSPSQAQAQANVLAVADDIIDNNELYTVLSHNCHYLKTATG